MVHPTLPDALPLDSEYLAILRAAHVPATEAELPVLAAQLRHRICALMLEALAAELADSALAEEEQGG